MATVSAPTQPAPAAATLNAPAAAGGKKPRAKKGAADAPAADAATGTKKKKTTKARAAAAAAANAADAAPPPPPAKKRSNAQGKKKARAGIVTPESVAEQPAGGSGVSKKNKKKKTQKRRKSAESRARDRHAVRMIRNEMKSPYTAIRPASFKKLVRVLLAQEQSDAENDFRIRGETFRMIQGMTEDMMVRFLGAIANMIYEQGHKRLNEKYIRTGLCVLRSARGIANEVSSMTLDK